MRAYWLLFVALVGPCPAQAADLIDWNVSPLSAQMGDWSATLGGTASAAGYVTTQQGDIGRGGITGAALATGKLGTQFDNGWDFAIAVAILPWHDTLSGDNYGDRFFEKDYVSLQTPFGRVEIGQQDGAAYRLSTVGPKVDDAVAIDEGTVTFFRNPLTGEAFADLFRLRTGEFATENFAKASYYSPRLFGIQLAGSVTPYQARDGLPFLSRGPASADRQIDMLEAGANDEQNIGAASLVTYAGVALAHDDRRTPGHGDLLDYAAGAAFDVDVADAKLSFGGGYRQSNAYAFDIDEAFRTGATRSARLSATVTKGPWIAGFEVSDGIAGREQNLPRLHETGFEPSIAYVVNSNLQLTLGWQHLDFGRDTGDFYNRKPDVSMQAVFLHMQFHV
ncbi:MAG: porin [Rhizomicrobium sp.]|jgi:hypothetical protein